MLNLTNKSKLEDLPEKPKLLSSITKTNDKEPRISVRDKLLIQEVQELHINLPSTCTVQFPTPSCLHQFELLIVPIEGIWQTGKFLFLISVPQEYNIIPPNVKCCTRIWHPNISEDGSVCLSLLRPTSVDGMGWAPTRKLKDIIWGLNSLFTDLLDFDNPLNSEAAEHFRKNPEEFQTKARDYIKRYSK